MPRLISLVFAALFLVLVLLACNKQEVVEEHAAGNINMTSITYSKVSYIASGTPHVEVRDIDGTVYVDYGTSGKSAKRQFDDFYMNAFGASGVITYSTSSSNELLIGEACFNCTSLGN